MIAGWRKIVLAVLAWAAFWAPAAAQAADAHPDPKLGLVSDTARGTKRFLVVLVNFPDVEPRLPLEGVKERAVPRVDRWYQQASHGQTRFAGTIKGPYTLPQPLAAYKVSPYNFKVDSKRVYALVRDALSLAEEDGTAVNDFDVVAVVHRCFTGPGKGYGMLCYCANPGMISKVRQGRARYVPITTRRGTVFQKGVVVMAENFNLGFMVHALAHAIGGVYQGTRLAPDLYDFEAQSRPRSNFQIHDASLYLGPWDIMSQHFLRKNEPPPGFSLFTMMRLGYIQPPQVELVRPGETSLARLSPLAQGGPLLGIKIPLAGGRYLLVENRQPVKVDRVLPASGIMVYAVDESREEGAGIVRAKNADPGAPNFSRAPFGVDGQAMAAFVDRGAGVAVVPIIKQNNDYLVLVTSPSQAEAAQKVARKLASLKGSPALTQKLPRVLQLLKSGKVAEAENSL
jgi:M6 family metalloprotease-like protein